MSFLFTSFNRRVMLLLAIAILPLIALMISNNLRRRSDRIHAARDHLQSVSWLLARNQETSLRATTHLLELIASQDYIRDGNIAVANAEFRKILADSPQLSNIGLAGMDGIVTASVLEQPPNNSLLDRRWFQGAVQTRHISAGEYRIGQVSRKPVIAFGCPVLGEDGKVTGVVFTSLVLTSLEDDLEKTGLSSQARLTLLSYDGKILVNFPWRSEVDDRMETAQALLTELDRPSGTAEIQEATGETRLYSFRKIAENIEPAELYLAVSIPRAAVTMPINKIFWRDISIMLLVVLSSLVLTWLLCTRLLTRRINRLVGVTRQLGEGNLEAQVPVERQHDEIGELDGAFNTMARRLKARDEEVHQKQAEILETKLQLLQSQKMELLGRLAGGLAHDLKNVLMVVGGSAQLIEQDAPDEATLRLAQQIITASENAGMMIGHLLAFSRNQSVETQSVDLNQIILEGNGLIQHLVGRKVKIEVNLDPQINNITAAPSQITQIVLNLAINARDAMHTGGTLKIETCPCQKQSVMVESPFVEGVCLRVTDTGHGIDETIIERVFDPFFTTKPDSRGTGLGLSSVQTIVRTLGGSIEIVSAPGQGACFEIFFPCSPMTD